ncbi:cytosine deaminase [Alteribacillus iranensis]|uniref:Cytosine deaminase n=1 Tax=Alteribacillus iranensis TaxID=930128 RepID=A0A1I2E5Y8_9BACI|nr:cytosine deaminase [Alteribacillus iranensis]SFE87911.1 cytosine deaminase [Alteribacillus iranensis]
MLIRNARLRHKKGLWDLLIKDGTIQQIEANISLENEETIDANGSLVIPPFVDPHIHLDSVLTAGEPEWNLSGTLFEGIERWSQRRETLSATDVKERATLALKWQAAQGVQFVRTHVDITDPQLIALKTLLELKEEMSDYLDLQIVAFPQEGIQSYPQGEELLEESLRMGADVVGGIPHFEFTREYGVDSLRTAFQLAQKYNRPVDIHCDETDDEQSRFIEVVAAEALRSGLGKQVTASHTTAMHSYNNAYTAKLFRLLQKAEINIIANPLINIHLQGRFDSYPKRRGITRVKELLEADINVSFGHDNISDPWYPLGTGNMLQVLHMGIHVSHLMGYEEINSALDLITNNSARTLQVEESYGITEGKPANFIVLGAENEFEAIQRQAPVLYSIRNGSLISHTKPAETFIHTPNKQELIPFQRP